MAEGDAEGRSVFVQCGTLLEHLSRDNTGVFHFTATVSGYKLRLAVAEDDLRLPYGLNFGRIAQFIRCRFAGDEVGRELALQSTAIRTSWVVPEHFCRRRPDAGTIAKDVNPGYCNKQWSPGTFDAEMGSPDGHRKGAQQGWH
jgi:hypothetical protein